MAIIFPEFPGVRTAGEQELIDLLCDCLDNTWIIFFEPLIEGTRPDIVLYSQFHGVIIVEVKDWTRQTIISLAPDQWVINTEIGEKKVSSPLKQVSEYGFRLINILSKHNELIHPKGNNQGNLKFPVGHICLFARLSSDEIDGLRITSVMPEKYVLCKEDILQGYLIEKIVRVITEIFTIKPLPTEVSNKVKQLLYPEYQVRDDSQKKITEFNLNTFPSLVDEILFICTELREWLRTDTNQKVVVYYDTNRFLKHRSISEEIKMILEDMGLLLASNGGYIELLSLENEETFKENYEWAKVFVIDFKHIQWTTKKEVFLDQLSKKTPDGNFICTYHN